MTEGNAYKSRPRILMEDARQKLEDGTFRPVSARLHLSGSFLKAVQDASRNHELHCPNCSATVHFVKPARRAVAGTNQQAVSPHFRLAAGETHEDVCPLKRFEGIGSESTTYDPALGWRIHLNTRDFSTEYATRDAVYFRDERHHLKVNPRRLPQGETAETFMARSTVAVKNVKELLAHIEGADIKRLRDSYVVYEDKVIPWDSFFIRGKRYPELMQRLASGASNLPVLLHLHVEKPQVRKRWGNSVHAAGEKFFWQRNTHGDAVFVEPRIWLDSVEDSRLREAFDKAGEYFVLGLARLTHPSGGLKAINVSATSHEQIVRQDLADIVAKVEQRNPHLRDPAND